LKYYSKGKSSSIILILSPKHGVFAKQNVDEQRISLQNFKMS
jgi:hypothetical protein